MTFSVGIPQAATAAAQAHPPLPTRAAAAPSATAVVATPDHLPPMPKSGIPAAANLLQTRQTGSLTATDGQPIPYRVTLPSGPIKAVAVMQMGTLGTPEYFDQMADKLAASGIACYAVGSRTSAPEFKQHARDLDAVVRQARQDHPAAPLRVMGVSLGATIALDWSATHNPEQTPVCAMAPVVLPTFLTGKDMGRIAHGLVSEKAARKPVNTPMSAGRALTTNPASPEASLANPESMQVPAALFGDVTKMTTHTLANGHAMKGRLLVAIAGDDDVSAAPATRAFAKAIRSRDKQVTTFPGLAHDMSQESHDATFVKALTGWLLQTP